MVPNSRAQAAVAENSRRPPAPLLLKTSVVGLSRRWLASIAQLREALGEGGERVEASVDAVERVLREVQAAWKKDDE